MNIIALITAALQYGVAPSSEPDYMGLFTIPALILCGIFLLLFTNWILHLGEDKEEYLRTKEEKEKLLASQKKECGAPGLSKIKRARLLLFLVLR